MGSDTQSLLIRFTTHEKEKEMTTNQTPQGFSLFAKTMITIGMLLAAVVVYFKVLPDPNVGNNAVSAPTTSVTAPSGAAPADQPAAVPLAQPEDCPDSRPVYQDPNVGNDAVTGGVKNDAEIRMHMDREPAYLAYAASGFLPDKYPAVPEWKTLVSDDRKCFNMKGLMLRAEIEGVMASQTTKVEENVAIPSDYYNTGMQSGMPVVNQEQGIPSGRVGTRYTQGNGTETYVDYHCANIPKKGVPQGYAPVYFPPVPPVIAQPPVVVQPPAPTTIVQTNVGVGVQVSVTPRGECHVCGQCGNAPCYTPPTTTWRPPPPPPPTTTTPPPVYHCPPGTTGHYPNCKDTEADGPATVVTPQQQPNPLPALPQYEEPTHPDVAPPPPVYSAPTQQVVVPVPEAQDGPKRHTLEIPRIFLPRQAEAPAPEAPSTSCIAAPGSEC